MFGYVFYWCNYFGFSVQKARYKNKYDKIRTFMATNCNRIVSKKDLEQLFSEFIKIKPKTRFVTYNNFRKKNLIFYEIVSDRKNSLNTRKRRAMIKKVDAFVDG